MIVNRLILTQHGISNSDSSSLLAKANSYRGVKVFDKMIKNRIDALVATPHFDINEMIDGQKRFNDEVRAFNLPRNLQFLKMLEKVRDKLIIEKLASEVTAMKFNDIETIYKDIHDSYPIKNKKLSDVIADLKNGYIAIKY